MTTDPTADRLPIAALLGADGPFARDIDRFRVRPGQQRLADDVATALREGSSLVAEAGTGIGKTFAYLVPSLELGLRTLVSTGTRTLQDQLFHRDLPAVQRVLGTHRTTALLKGRANYLCLYRTDRLRLEAPARRSASLPLEALQAWGTRTRSGDMGEFPGQAGGEPWLSQVTSTAENCLGQECPRYGDCFLIKARARAQRSDVVVVNHHLLFADMALKREGFGELLPTAEAVIVDEAHRVPETATRFFGLDLSHRMITELRRDTLAEAGASEGALGAITEPAESLELALRRFRLALEPLPPRGAWGADTAVEAITELQDALSLLEAALAPLAQASRGLENCWVRAREQVQRIERIRAGTAAHVAWYERAARGFTLHLSPLEISEELSTYRSAGDAAWVFTSATLSAGGDFSLFQQRLGLDGATTASYPSPFDYETNARVYLPPDLPPPASADFVARLLAAIEPVLEATEGHAFLLFTSHRNLREAAALLRSRDRFPLFVQGEAPRQQLLDAFMRTANALLLGAASFWEGVDVPGRALRCVVIDKLPFAAPDDPVLQGRLGRIRELGGDPFRNEQLPQAVITLKQGVGRLIRGESDHGVVVLGDPRVVSKGYGRAFLRALPPMPVVRDISDVRQFLRQFD